MAWPFSPPGKKGKFQVCWVKTEQCREEGVCVGAGAQVYLHTQAYEDRPGKSTHTSEPHAFSKPAWTKINQIWWECVLHIHLSKNPSQDTTLGFPGAAVYCPGGFMALSWGLRRLSLQVGQLSRDRGNWLYLDNWEDLSVVSPQTAFKTPCPHFQHTTQWSAFAFLLAIWRHNWQNCNMFKCTPWWFAKRIHCETISTPHPPSG